MTALSFPPNVQALSNARTALAQCMAADPEDTLGKVLPRSGEKAEVLFRKVSSLLQKAETNAMITLPLSQDLIRAVTDFEKTLQEELGHIYAYAVTEQRIISVKVMLETPRDALNKPSF